MKNKSDKNHHVVQVNTILNNIHVGSIQQARVSREGKEYVKGHMEGLNMIKDLLPLPEIEPRSLAASLTN